MKNKALTWLARWAAIAAIAAVSAVPVAADRPLVDQLYEDAKETVEGGPGQILSPDEWEREFPQLRQSVQNSTNVRNSMLSGRLEWKPGTWSDCEVTNIPYCGTYEGIQRRPINCILGSIKGSNSSQQDNHCINGVGPKPPTTRSCSLVVNTDCTPPPAVVSVTATPSGQLLADGKDTATLTAIMRHADGSRAAGERVQWAATRGVMSTSSTTTNANGETSITLKSSSIGSSRITASSYDSTAVANVSFISAVPSLVTLTASPSNGLIAGRDTSTITASLKYGNGRAASGYTVNFYAPGGSLNASRRTTNAAGQAAVVLQKATAGTVLVEARSEGSTRNTSVNFAAPVPSLVSLSASPNAGIVADGSASSTITATVQYQTGEPAANQPVSFSTNLGRLSATTRNTNSAGQASVTIRSSSTGTARVTASSNGSRSTNVGFVTFRDSVGGEFRTRISGEVVLDFTASIRITNATPSSMSTHRVIDAFQSVFGSLLVHDAALLQSLGFSQMTYSIGGNLNYSCTHILGTMVDFNPTGACKEFNDRAFIHGSQGGQYEVILR